MRKFNVIYADPPWQYGSKQYQDNGRPFDPLNRQYSTMSIEQIKKLPIKNIADDNCALFMWCTDSHLKEGIEVMESWGFKYKTIAFVWIKKYKNGNICVNFAPHTLKSSEICLLGIRGTMKNYKKSNNVRQLLEAVRIKHSQKPEEARIRIIELYGEIPKIELFARQKSDGWSVWGDEVKSDLELTPIQ